MLCFVLFCVQELLGTVTERVDYSAAHLEAWQDALAVQDQEVKVERWVEVCAL